MNPPAAAFDAAGEVYPIRTVCSLTGVNPITLRAWERRYGLIKPARTEAGHRAYSSGDIDTVHRILALARRGVAIGRMREALAADAQAAPAAALGQPASGAWAEARRRMSAAIAQFDEARLEAVYGELLALHPIERVTQQMLMPLLAELGERWQGAPGGVAEEHFFAAYLRNKLGARLHHRRLDVGGPRLLLACLPGEQHEIGLLLFALAAHEQGFRLVMLGADMPFAELAHAALRSQAAAVVLSGSVVHDAGLFGEPLQMLVRHVPVPVFVGGGCSLHCRDAIVASGARPLGQEMAAALLALAAALKTAAH